ncbi:hypothetical protein [Tenacibaculum amylolyticum]|uniref:hypothetical protein n=1 Tax=Tenacibaculum amylolyticum TaxID=104269 RepID=UPI0038951D0C
MRNLLRKHIEGKSIVWFLKSNQYVVLENLTADILIDIDNNVTLEQISLALSEQINVPIEEGLQFVSKIKRELFDPNIQLSVASKETVSQQKETSFEVTKFYTINDLVFRVDFQSEFEVYLIHPKFSHLETLPTEQVDHIYQVSTKNDITFLYIDNIFIDAWHRKEIHYFQGKFSMHIVQNMHNKPENDWMGVFHASGVANDSKSLLLLGDSGNGKSTSLAILQANGLTCLADDFVPIGIQQQHVYTFPSAISIKKNSLETLIPLYPELTNTAEFHFERLKKIVRFLPPKTIDYNLHLPCNDLVFIKYQKDSGLQFNSISKLEAFQKLVPDSWISKKLKNVDVFLNWFSNVNCYQLIYSENDKMVNTVKSILQNDL